MVTECPSCSDNARFGVVDAAKTLGLDRKTFRRYATRLRLSPQISRLNGRSVWTGRQLKTIWRAAI